MIVRESGSISPVLPDDSLLARLDSQARQAMQTHSSLKVVFIIGKKWGLVSAPKV
jgi:hypothetical protein